MMEGLPQDGMQTDMGQEPIYAENATETPEVVTLSRDQMLAELLAFCVGFQKKSADWRRSSYEDQWRRWQRNADSMYDPAVAAKKEPWQSKTVWPLTASHLENAVSQLFKTEVGPTPPFNVKARPGVVPKGVPGADQSENIQDLILREREKAEYDVNRNPVIIDKGTYGSGFMQAFFETVIEDRLVWEDVTEEVLSPEIDGGASVQRSVMGQPAIVGRRQVMRPQVIYRGMRARHISIWDVFPDPQALQVKGHPIAIRYKTTYEDILDGANPQADGTPGYVIPEAVENLRETPSSEATPSDKQAVQSDRDIAEARIERTKYGRIFECYELQARLPKKWVLINGEDIDDPDALIPAVVRFHESTIICVHPSDAYDGEPNIYKDNYFDIPGAFYGRGICEMVKDSQEVATETVCQRLDAGAISLKKVFAVIAKCIVDPKDLDGIGNGGTIRFKSQEGLTNIDQLFKSIDMGSTDRSAFLEPQEWERAAQERTSITATTLGSEDNTRTTLGAQQIQQGVTGGKIAYIGMLSEKGFQRQMFYAFYKGIYQNYKPEDYAMALGPERAATIISLTPEQLNNSYSYTALGVFEQENKAQRQQQLAAWDAQFGMTPWANRVEIAKEELRSMGQDADRFILAEAEGMQVMEKAQAMAGQMVEQMQAQGPEGKSEPQGAPQ